MPGNLEDSSCGDEKTGSSEDWGNHTNEVGPGFAPMCRCGDEEHTGQCESQGCPPSERSKSELPEAAQKDEQHDENDERNHDCRPPNL